MYLNQNQNQNQDQNLFIVIAQNCNEIGVEALKISVFLKKWFFINWSCPCLGISHLIYLMVIMIRKAVNIINVKVLCVSIYLALVWGHYISVPDCASSLFRLLSAGVHAHPRTLSGVVATGVLYGGDWWGDSGTGQEKFWTVVPNCDKQKGLLATQYIAPCG